VVQNVDAGYGAVQVLHDVSIAIHEGETVVLLGTNGNGKSTLIRCIMGLVRPEAGNIFLENDGQRTDLIGKMPQAIVNLGITLVPEGRRLFAKLTVEENLLLGAFRPEARQHITANLQLCVETFPILRDRRRQLAGSLSGGDQQMLAVARALMAQPKILLVDEPSVGLAPIFVSRVIAKIKELQERYGLTVLMAEQNFHQATQIADRGYILVEGQIAFEGRSTAELSSHALVKQYYLGL
jgi:branched-chain amino acid transport system ATP-binding protein